MNPGWNGDRTKIETASDFSKEYGSERGVAVNKTDKTIAGRIAESIKKNKELPAFNDYGGETSSYREVGFQIAELHKRFMRYGIQKPHKVALLGKNCANWAVVYLAALTSGITIVPILPDFHTDEVHTIVNHSGAVMLFAATEWADRIELGRLPAVKAVLRLEDFLPVNGHEPLCGSPPGETHAGETLQSTPDFIETLPRSDETAVIVYTSGTTGLSKGVVLAHASLTANVDYAIRTMPLNPGDHVLAFLPLAHAFGCAFDFLFPFTRGCHITFMNRLPSPRVIIKAFEEVRPHLILTVPLVLEKIYKSRIRPALGTGKMQFLLAMPLVRRIVLTKMRTKLMDVFGGRFNELIVGGAALDTEVESFLKKIKFPFTIGYGLTECGPLVSYASPEMHKPFSVGRLVDTLEARVLKSDPGDSVGEILVRGDNVMSGYYRNPEATAETLDADGWLHTGDMGHIDDEGFVFLKGRSKNMILSSSGQNIYPEEIETRLNRMPYVEESLVVQAQNGKLKALVVADAEAIKADQLPDTALADIMEGNRHALNRKLPAYSSIASLSLQAEAFVKTPTKKIKRGGYTA